MKKRRKRRGHYITGVHVSTKTGQECRYRSGWERLYMIWLDANADVKTYLYEGVTIPYLSNLRTRKVRQYHPDFLVELVDGRLILVEIKPRRRLDQARVRKKLAAAEAWSRVHGATFQVVTEDDLRNLGLL